jgi:hypothetical protein
MIIKVNVNGRDQLLDLSPVKHMSDLKVGDEVICRHPATGRLCRARVESGRANLVTLRDTAREPAPYRWSIGKLKLRETVYKINK